MNVRVDLILKSERRSASPINMRSLSRLATVLVPVALVAVVVVYAVNIATLKSKVRMVERAWEEAEPKRKEALKLRAVAGRNETILQELEKWKQARISWSDHLRALQETVRPSIQMTKLQVLQSVQIMEGGVPARVFTVAIEGIAVGRSAKEDVDHLQRGLRTVEPFDRTGEDVAITHFAAAPGRRSDRVFSLKIALKPQGFGNED